MREIKFRGYSANELSGSQWVKNGYGVTKIEYTDRTSSVHLLTPYGDYQVEEESVGQFTGMKDEKGNEIFEGDIIRYKSKDINKIGKIMYGLYDEEYQVDLGFYIKWIDGEYLRNDLGYWLSRGIEVIGNSYDNK